MAEASAYLAYAGTVYSVGVGEFGESAVEIV